MEQIRILQFMLQVVLRLQRYLLKTQMLVDMELLE
jgi:hypothetical protein